MNLSSRSSGGLKKAGTGCSCRQAVPRSKATAPCGNLGGGGPRHNAEARSEALLRKLLPGSSICLPATLNSRHAGNTGVQGAAPTCLFWAADSSELHISWPGTSPWWHAQAHIPGQAVAAAVASVAQPVVARFHCRRLSLGQQWRRRWQVQRRRSRLPLPAAAAAATAEDAAAAAGAPLSAAGHWRGLLRRGHAQAQINCTHCSSGGRRQVREPGCQQPKALFWVYWPTVRASPAAVSQHQARSTDLASKQMSCLRSAAAGNNSGALGRSQARASKLRGANPPPCRLWITGSHKPHRQVTLIRYICRGVQTPRTRPLACLHWRQIMHSAAPQMPVLSNRPHATAPGARTISMMFTRRYVQGTSKASYQVKQACARSSAWASCFSSCGSAL